MTAQTMRGYVPSSKRRQVTTVTTPVVVTPSLDLEPRAQAQTLALVPLQHVQFDRPLPSSAPALLDFGLNDHGNAGRLIALHGDNLRYCHTFKKWLVWDGRRWAIDDAEQARKLGSQTMLEFLRQVIAYVTDDEGKLRTFATQSLNNRGITNLLRMAQSEIFVRPADLDIDPYLLNFLNGTIDLRTGKLRPHRREDFITKLVAHRYIPNARCPHFLAFLTEIMGGDREMVRYLQRALGYSLTGCTIEKAVFILFGTGDNGKTTLLSTIRKLIEEYAMLLQVDTLLVKQESNNTQADLADLRGARFVQTSETEDGQRLAQGKLKRITQGMGSIKAVKKYENPIEFPESHKLWMDTNRKPTITDADDKATFKRLHPIPFTVTIPKERQDPELPAKLLSEAEGILRWIVEGAGIWYRERLGKPRIVEAANQQWMEDSDRLQHFIDERLKAGGSVGAEELYLSYRDWAEGRGEKRILGMKDFAIKITGREGISKRRDKHSVRYEGIQIRQPGRVTLV
jgi:putative DNA primase/helicase